LISEKKETLAGAGLRPVTNKIRRSTGHRPALAEDNSSQIFMERKDKKTTYDSD